MRSQPFLEQENLGLETVVVADRRKRPPGAHWSGPRQRVQSGQGHLENEGDCVSFVAAGGKNPPAGSEKP
jgi:hypothetical protein